MKSKSGKIPQPQYGRKLAVPYPLLRDVPQEQSQPILLLLLQVQAILGKLDFILSLYTTL